MTSAVVKKGAILMRRSYAVLLSICLCLSFLFKCSAIEWQSFEYGKFAIVSFDTNSKPGFTLLMPETTGVFFTNQLSEDRHLTNQILLNGSGCAVADVDGDGLCDIYFCGLDSNNKLFKNLGNFKFVDITEKAGVACAGWDCTGAVFADVDGDGDFDLIVNTIIHGTHIFFNDGKGVFTEKPCNAGLNVGNCGTSIALGDIDGDGDLDLYIANYRPVTLRDQPNTPITVSMEGGKPVVKRVAGRPLTDPDLTNRFTFNFVMTETGITMTFEENGQPDLLCLNDGNGCFTPVSWTDGRFLDEDGKPLSTPPHDWGLTATIRDLNQDGFPDIYVCNDFRSPDRMWINNGKGQFRLAPRTAIRQTCLSSMGADYADINRDGYDDIFSLDMLSRDHFRRFSQRIDMRPEILPIGAIENRPQYSRNMLQLNRGDNTYAEIAQMCGVEGAEWSWIPAFIDVDLDGYEDILIPNGFERDNMNVDALQRIEMAKKEKRLTNVELLRLRKMFPRLLTPNIAFKNHGNLKFEEVGEQWGFNASIISQSIAFADLDNDGDLDVILNNLNTNAHVYRNNAPAPRLGIKLVGKGKNTHGIGSRIIIKGAAVVQSQEMMNGGRYLAGDNPMRVFAAGSAKTLTAEIRWRDGFTSIISNLVPNRIYEIDENKCALLPTPARQPLSQLMFEDVSMLLNHMHVEEPFDDFARQKMLLNKLSQLGPGVAWFDINNDGADDLIIGSGRGGTTAIYMNVQNGNFLKINESYLLGILPRDQMGIVCFNNAQKQPVILTAYSSYEDGDLNHSVIFSINPATKSVSEDFPGNDSAVGHLAMADVDNDGWLDLFIAGRVIPGAYPYPASSMLLLYKNNQWTVDKLNTDKFKQIGMVNSAVFTDIDNDGDPDLVLTCEWGAIKIFRNDKGAFSPMDWKIKLPPGLNIPNQPTYLSQLTGWWTGVTAGDFDGDGKMDIAVGNWGKNTKWESFRSNPIKLYYGDFDDDGMIDVIESIFDVPSGRWVPFQPFNLVGAAIPVLRTKIGSFEAYARCSLQDIYGEALNNKLKSLEAVCLESCVFLNCGDHFEVHPLPIEAQMTPIFALCVSDFDGDGIEDLFISQNFFAVSIETSRYDAGRGLLLKGKTNGEFEPIPGHISGILVYGEQRGAAVSDFNSDGRPDIVVTQNANATKLYKNTLGKPGLRIRLEDPTGNRNGVGAKIRIGAGGVFSPAREIHAGSGWFSQDSAVQILQAPPSNGILQVQWQGNVVREYQIPENSKEVVVYPDGKIVKAK